MSNPANLSAVFLPLELRVRELDAKLALACGFLSRGIPVLIGQQWAIYSNLATLPIGFALFKSYNRVHYRAADIASATGHVTAALDEEMMAATTAEAVADYCHIDAFSHFDWIFAHGKVERESHLSRGCDPEKLFTSGNPRLDILKPDLRSIFKLIQILVISIQF
jgi:surface carbohydrate biosynthesis protein